MRRGTRDERGATSVLLCLLVSFVLMISAAFVVDLGMQRVVRRDMQAVADVVALDLARLLDGSTVDEYSTATFDAARNSSVSRNWSSAGDDLEPEDVDWEFVVRNGDGWDVVTDPTAVPEAVRVTASSGADFAFGGITGVERGVASRTAVATSEERACFRLGSFAAALDTGGTQIEDVFESMLTDAFGVQMTAIGYRGLINSFVQLEDIAAELGVGTLDALVANGNLTVKEVLEATARALDNDGQTDANAQAAAQAAEVVAELAAKVDADLRMDVAEIIAVGDGAAVRGSINTLDLLGSIGLSAATEIANSNNFLDTGVVWADPWLSKGDVKLTIIEAPRGACGPVGTEARTAQIRLDTNLALELSGEKIEGLALSTVDGTNKTRVQVSATVAGAQGALTGLTCGDGIAAEPEEIRVRVDTNALSIDVSVPFLMRGEIAPDGILSAAYLDSLSLGKLVSASLVLDLDVNAKISTSLAPRDGTEDTVYAVPPRDYLDPEPSPGSSGPVSIPSVRTAEITARTTAKLKVKVLGGLTTVVDVPFAELNLTGLRNAVLHGPNRVGISLDNVTKNVNAALVPVSELLGLQVGGADVFGVPRPECGAPWLVG